MKAIRKVLETLRNVFSVPELRAKILFTIVIVLVYRFGAQIPVPYVNADQLEAAFSAYSNTIFTYLNLLSGSAFSRATLLALSISPYITSSIVMQLLCVAIPALERMSKEDDGREKIQKITRFVTVGLGIITAIGYYVYLNSQNLISLPEGMPKWFAAVVMIACYSAAPPSSCGWVRRSTNGASATVSRSFFSQTSFPAVRPSLRGCSICLPTGVGTP